MRDTSRGGATPGCAPCSTKPPWQSSRACVARATLRSWALALRKRLGFKRAAVALARKLAVIMHAMLKTGTDFDPRPPPRHAPESCYWTVVPLKQTLS